MSVCSDDTDVLLLVPPDLFVVPDDVSPEITENVSTVHGALEQTVNFDSPATNIPNEMRRCESADTLTPTSRSSLRPRSLQSTPLKHGSPHRNILICEPYLSQRLRDDQCLREIDEYFKVKQMNGEKYDVSQVKDIIFHVEETQKEINAALVNGVNKECQRSDDCQKSLLGIRRSLNFDSPTKCSARTSESNSHMEELCIQTSDEGKQTSEDLLSLQHLWNDNSSKIKSTVYEERQLLRQRLEEERCRRQHCEELIRDLQKKQLEGEEKLAVALKVDNEKDIAIKKLKEGWSQVVEQWKVLDSQKNDLTKQLGDEKLRFEDEKAVLSGSVKKYESELSKALDLAHGYKEKCETAIKDQKIASRDRELICLELESLKEKLQIAEDGNLKLDKKIQEKDDLLNQWKLKVTELTVTVKDLKKQLKCAQGDKDRIQQEKNAKAVVQENLDDAQKRELKLQEQLRVAEKSKSELKQYYQQQVEAIVLEKQKEFQNQLLNAEKSLQKQLETRERALTDNTGRQIQQLNEKHKLEISLMDEKQAEEIRLHKICIAQCHEKIEDLQKIVENQACSQNELAEKLHYVMETQWKETLKIISSSQVSKSENVETNAIPKLSRQNTFTKEVDCSLPANEPAQTMGGSARRPGCQTYRIDETPQKISPDPKLREYIDRLLQRPCDIDDSACSSRLDPSCNSVNEPSANSKCVSAGEKRPWR